MTGTPISQYLSTAPAPDIVQWLESLETAELGQSALHALLVTDPAKGNNVLCELYDVACYKVGDSCFADDAPVEERGKWFISVIAGTFCDVDMVSLPLADSLSEAQAIAVAELQLKELFFGAPPRYLA